MPRQARSGICRYARKGGTMIALGPRDVGKALLLVAVLKFADSIITGLVALHMGATS